MKVFHPLYGQNDRVLKWWYFYIMADLIGDFEQGTIDVKLISRVQDIWMRSVAEDYR